jgi:hypothetical protein
MSYIIKAITANDILSFIGGEDGCSYMIDEKEAWIFDSPEKAIVHLKKNFIVFQLATNKFKNKYGYSSKPLVPSTIFLIEEII